MASKDILSSFACCIPTVKTFTIYQSQRLLQARSGKVLSSLVVSMESFCLSLNPSVGYQGRPGRWIRGGPTTTFFRVLWGSVCIKPHCWTDQSPSHGQRVSRKERRVRDRHSTLESTKPSQPNRASISLTPALLSH